MGLLTLRPFAHYVYIPTLQYFHSYTQLKPTTIEGGSGDGIRISDTSDSILWIDSSLGVSDHSPIVTGFEYANNKLVHINNYMGNTFNPYDVRTSTSACLTSYDGQIWFPMSVATTTINDMTSGNGIFVAVNEPPTIDYVGYVTTVSTSKEWKPISTSTDGFNWFEQEVPLTIEDRYDHVVFNGTDFKVIGTSSVLTSTDGVNWLEQYVDFPHHRISINQNGYSSNNTRHYFTRNTESPVLYGSGKYSYLAAVVNGDMCITPTMSISSSSYGNDIQVINNVYYGCERIIESTGLQPQGDFTVSAPNGYGIFQWETNTEDFHDYGVLYTSVTGNIGLSDNTDHISGKKKGTILVHFGGYDNTVDISLDFSPLTYNGVSSTSGAPVFTMSLQLFEIATIDMYAITTTDFINFDMTKVIVDIGDDFRVFASGYTVDRWVHWIHVYDNNLAEYVDYVIYSTDGITWNPAASIQFAELYNTNPGYAEILPALTSHDPINKQYRIGHQGGSIMTSDDGVNWTLWMVPPTLS